ncbi:MAG: diphthamide biosynthesis enzyme Dph2 [Candidatus Bathyarchaeota archaeon]|nr:diphthamide biosynthesis enzyme Dph2 [Candidatus Bathyarchaeota archaeon]
MVGFDLEEERIKQEIRSHEAKRVVIQLPDGLRREAARLAEIIEKEGALAIVSADPCYGACDLVTDVAESLDADLVIHFGHSRMLKRERVATVYVEAKATISVDKAVEEAVLLLEKWQKIGLATTVQHVHKLDRVKEILNQHGKTVIVGDAGHLAYAGQVIGCDYSNAKAAAREVDAFLFVGGGRFHALGVALSTSKPVIVADPYEHRAFAIDQTEEIFKQRWACINEAKKAQTFAILVGLKPGQKRMEKALEVKKTLEEHGKKAFLFAVTEVTPDILRSFPSVDAFINTSCPRVSIDDYSRFHKPVLTPAEAFVVAGTMSWEDLCKRSLLES